MSPDTPSRATAPLLEVTDLSVRFASGKGLVPGRSRSTFLAVDSVSFNMQRTETLGLVGESGCGKTTTGRAVLGLIRPSSGSVNFEGLDIGRLSARALRRQRRHMQMVFQDPYSSLDPRMRVGEIVKEPLVIHQLSRGGNSAALVKETLAAVGLSPDATNRYPHEFSGGQRQRIAIARALIVNPSLVVCDEPTSSLDVSIQAQVLNLFMDLRDRLGLSYLFISHDIAVVRHLAQRVAVMYMGRIVELGDCESVLSRPLHPYTQSLLRAVPRLEATRDSRPASSIAREFIAKSSAGGESGCNFRARCPFASEICEIQEPELDGEARDHKVACHLWEKVARTSERTP